MSLEIHVNTRSRLRPDPEYDSLTSLFFVFAADEGCKDVCKRTGKPTQNGSCIDEGDSFLVLPSYSLFSLMGMLLKLNI